VACDLSRDGCDGERCLLEDGKVMKDRVLSIFNYLKSDLRKSPASASIYIGSASDA
jgi:hypothetical protein